MGASRHYVEQNDHVQAPADGYLRRRIRRKLRSDATDEDVALVWTAHELRSPVLAVKGAIERVVVRASGLSATDRRILRRSASELTRLASSIESILSLSLRPLVLHPQRTNLVRLVREAVSSCTVDGGSERVWLRSPSSVAIMADAPRLRAAIANVVRNALAYSPTSTSVHIEVRQDEDSVSVLVKDAGPGISRDEADAIFKPFVRGSAQDATDGLGVGLTLAKQIVEAHNGTISLIAEGPGSLFVIRLKGPEVR